MLSNPISISSTLYPTLPVPSPFISLIPIFGTSPTMRISTFYDLIALQIGAIAFSKTVEGEEIRPVLLGIALKIIKGKEEEEEEEISELERELFSGIMEMVLECI